MILLETDLNPNKNISSAVEVGSYTAAAIKLLHVRIFADQVTGGGDYTAYLTIQRSGAGSSYILEPITTITLPADVTSVAFISIPIVANSSDVIKAWIDGLPADITTPDITVEWWEDDANPTAISTAVWANPTRTITMSAAQVIAALSGSAISILRGDQYNASLTNLGDITNWKDLWLTGKRHFLDSDEQSIFQLHVSNPPDAAEDGLIYLNGAPAVRSQGSLTVTDEATGDVDIVIDDTATTQLVVESGLHYDVQVGFGINTTQTLSIADAEVTEDYTRELAD